MPSAAAPNPHATSNEPDELDRFFGGYDDAVEDFMKDIPIERDATKTTSAPTEPVKDIDAEIQVKKKRKPIPKLDDNRLLSANGLSKLRKITKSRLKFRGKGHEFSDIARLLVTYQLWLDDLYPRAKFRDALAMAEKAGHGKRMGVMRKAWLDDTKPYRKEATPEELEQVQTSRELPVDGSRPDHDSDDDDDEGIFGEAAQQQASRDSEDLAANSNGAPDENELDALLAEQDPSRSTRSNTVHPRRKGPFDEDSEEDELDALLAAEPSHNPTTNIATKTGSRGLETSRNKTREDDFADEEEAMAGMDFW